MNSDDERPNDPPTSRPPVGELPGQLSFDRLDGGDPESLDLGGDPGSRGESGGGAEPAVEEAPRPVDEPVRVVPPYDRADKRRNQRRLPR